MRVTIRKSLLCVIKLTCLLSLSMLFHERAGASTQCTPDSVYGGQNCISQVSFSQFAETAYETQQLTEWCWAASIAMVWGYYQHPIAQSEIVNAVFGGVVNSPAQDAQIIQALSGVRTDDNGRQFQSAVTGVYDAASGADTLSYTQLGAELDQGHPIIIGTVNADGSGGHAVVLTAISYYVPAGYPVQIDPYGTYITGAGVFDPWPGNGAHPISLSQLTPVSNGGTLFLVATIRVTDLASSAPTSPSNAPGSGGSGYIDPLSEVALLIGVLLCFIRRVST